MARKESDFTATYGRDASKVFHIREMPAIPAQKWAIRAVLAIGKSGITVPEGFEQLGMEGFASLVATIGLRALFGAQFDDAEPLLDELMKCVTIKPDASNPLIERPLMTDSDVEEVQTLFALQNEVVALHTGFSIAAELRKWGSAVRTGNLTPPTPTAGTRKARSSRRGSPAS